MAHEATILGIGVGMGAGGMSTPTVLLEARDEIVPIFISASQAQAIEQARQDIPVERPLTHDLFVDVLADLDGTLERVRIDDLADGTFYAKLDLTMARGAEPDHAVRDARPSDGIALAVRVGCPITVADAVINEAGQPPVSLGLEDTIPGPGGPPPGDVEPDLGSETPTSSEGEASDAFDLNDAVEIDIDEPGETDPDDEPED